MAALSFSSLAGSQSTPSFRITFYVSPQIGVSTSSGHRRDLSCGLGEKAKQVTQLARTVEEAQKNLADGDTSGAFGALLGGGEAVQPVDFRSLTPLLPANLPGFEKRNAGGEKSSLMGMATSKAEAEYHSDESSSRIDLSIHDLGSVRGFGMLGFNWLRMDIDKEDENGYERTTEYEGYPAFEKFQQDGEWSRGQMSVFVADRIIVTVDGKGVSDYEKFSRAGTSSQGTLQVIVGKRFVVEVASRGLEMESVRAAMDRIDLDELNAMTNAGATPES